MAGNDTNVKQNSWHHFCTTGLQRDMYTSTWTIENISFFKQKEKINSKMFCCCEPSKSNWFLRLYPKGEKEDCLKDTGIYLSYSPLNHMPAYIRYSVFLKDASNQIFWEEHGTQSVVNGESWGWEFMDFGEKLKHDILKIHVELVIFVESKGKLLRNVNAIVNNFSSTTARFEKCTLTWSIQNFGVVVKYLQKSLLSETFYDNVNSKWKWRLMLKAIRDVTCSKIVVGLIAEKKPIDVHYPVRYKIIARSPWNKDFNKTFEDQVIFSESEKLYVIGEQEALTDIFTCGPLQLVVYILVAIDTIHVRHFTTVSYEQNCQLAKHFSDIFDHAKYSDFSINVKGKKIPVHREILAARSPVFCSMLQHNMLEMKEAKVEIEDLDFSTITDVLRFMYTNKFTPKDDDAVINVLKASDKYQMDDLKKLCENYLVQNLNTYNAKEILIHAQIYQAPNLEHETRIFIDSFVDDFVLSFDNIMKCN